MMKTIIIQEVAGGFRAFFLNDPKNWSSGKNYFPTLASFIGRVQDELGLKIIELKLNEPVPEPDPQLLPFTGRTYNFELSYECLGHDGKRIKVGINSDCFLRTLDHIDLLLKNLRESIPFKFKVCNEPQIELLRDKRVRNFVSVEMVIEPTKRGMGRLEAICALEEQNFKKGFKKCF